MGASLYIDVENLPEHVSRIGPFDGVGWVVTALLHAVGDNAEWLLFRPQADRWLIDEFIDGHWREMVPFPAKVPVAEVWGQLARSGWDRPRWRHWWRAMLRCVRHPFRGRDPVPLELVPEVVWVWVPWRTVLWGRPRRGEVRVYIQATPAGRKIAGEIVDRWREADEAQVPEPHSPDNPPV